MHEHSHHAHQTGKRSLTQALIVVTVWFCIELAAGFYINSLALLADASHMLTDLAALSLSLFALKISARPATLEKTYGYVRAEILAALANGVILVIVGLGIAVEAVQRLRHPPEVNGAVMIVVAVAGLFANLVAARILFRADLENMNLRGAFLHVLGDIAGFAGTAVAGMILVVWQWYQADPAISLVVAGLILFSSWRLLRDSVDVLLEGTPRHVNMGSILSDLGSVSGVMAVHDLHVWSITSGLPALSCHVVVQQGVDPATALKALIEIVRERHHIDHTTIQIEVAAPDFPRDSVKVLF